MKIDVKQLLVCFGVLFFSFNVQAETKLGIGTELSSSYYDSGSRASFGTSVNFPIKISKSLMIEPGINFFSVKDKDLNGDSSSLDIKNLIVGIFVMGDSIAIVKPYYGIRLGVSQLRFKFKSSDGSFSSETDEENTIISPTIGGEIDVLENFSIASEMSFTYSKSDDRTIKNTSARLVVRMFF